jgi:hypothetical protein
MDVYPCALGRSFLDTYHIQPVCILQGSPLGVWLAEVDIYGAIKRNDRQLGAVVALIDS